MDSRSRSAESGHAIAETRAAFVAALERGDAQGVAAVYTDAATLIPPGAGLVQGREAIEAFWREGIESGITNAELESLELVPHGGLTHEIGRYALRLDPADGEAVVDRGTYLVLLARQSDGSWRRVIEMFSPNAPPTGDTLT